jgi:hypothetical protein
MTPATSSVGRNVFGIALIPAVLAMGVDCSSISGLDKDYTFDEGVSSGSTTSSGGSSSGKPLPSSGSSVAPCEKIDAACVKSGSGNPVQVTLNNKSFDEECQNCLFTRLDKEQAQSCRKELDRVSSKVGACALVKVPNQCGMPCGAK